MNHLRSLAAAAALACGVAFATPAVAQTTLRMAWYSDGNEGEVVKDLLGRFEAANPDIKVVLDQVPFPSIWAATPSSAARCRACPS